MASDVVAMGWNEPEEVIRRTAGGHGGTGPTHSGDEPARAVPATPAHKVRTRCTCRRGIPIQLASRGRGPSSGDRRCDPQKHGEPQRDRQDDSSQHGTPSGSATLGRDKALLDQIRPKSGCQQQIGCGRAAQPAQWMRMVLWLPTSPSSVGQPRTQQQDLHAGAASHGRRSRVYRCRDLHQQWQLDHQFAQEGGVRRAGDPRGSRTLRAAGSMSRCGHGRAQLKKILADNPSGRQPQPGNGGFFGRRQPRTPRTGAAVAAGYELFTSPASRSTSTTRRASEGAS